MLASSPNAERNRCSDCVEEEGRPRHQPDEAEPPEEPERNGVVVAWDAEVEVAQKMLVDEVEPEPAVDVALGRQWYEEVAVREGESAGMALRRVRQRDQDVPGCGDGEEDGERPRADGAGGCERAASRGPRVSIR